MIRIFHFQFFFDNKAVSRQMRKVPAADYRNFGKSESVNRFTREEWFKIIETWPILAAKCPREIFLHFDKFQWNKLSKAQSASISDMHLKSMLFKL